jgi:hypothetical protein
MFLHAVLLGINVLFVKHTTILAAQLPAITALVCPFALYQLCTARRM